MAGDELNTDDVDRENASNEVWEQPIKFDSLPPNPFPLEALPKVMEDAVRTVSNMMGSDPDLAAGFAIGVCSFAAARAVKLEIQPGHVESLNLWVMPIGPAGCGKTPQQKPLMAPLRAWIQEEQERIAIEIAPEQASYDLEQHEIESDQRKLAKMDSEKRDGLREALSDRMVEHRQRVRPSVPRLVVGDFTEAALSGTAANSGGVVLIFDDEGASIIQAVSGRHAGDGGTQASLFVKLWAGAAHDEARQSRESHNLTGDHVAAVVCPIQPELLETKNLRELRAQGVLDRFAIHSAGVSPVPPNPPPLDLAALSAYTQTLTSVLSLPRYAPGVYGEADGLSLSMGARDARTVFIDNLNRRVVSGDLESLSGPVAKLRANVERLSGVFHLIKFPTEAALRVPVSRETMEEAIEVGRYWLGQLLAIHRMFDKPEREAHAERVLKWIERRILDGKLAEPIFKRRDAAQGLKGPRASLSTSDEMSRALAELVDRDFIRLIEKRPETYEINPLWWAEIHETVSRESPGCSPISRIPVPNAAGEAPSGGSGGAIRYFSESEIAPKEIPPFDRLDDDGGF